MEIDAEQTHSHEVARDNEIDVVSIAKQWRAEYGRDGQSIHLFLKQYADTLTGSRSQTDVKYEVGDKVQLIDIDHIPLDELNTFFPEYAKLKKETHTE